MNQTQSNVLLIGTKTTASIKKIKSKYITVKPFSFRPVTAKDVLDVTSTLDGTKSSGGDIP